MKWPCGGVDKDNIKVLITIVTIIIKIVIIIAVIIVPITIIIIIQKNIYF